MFRQRATGQFTVPVVAGTPHCGVDHTACTCTYRLEIVFADDALDADGFLLDNTAFQTYFLQLSKTPVTVSCENLCRRICADLCDMCGNRARRATVALSPFAGVEVEYTFRPTTSRKRESTRAILREFQGVAA